MPTHARTLYDKLWDSHVVQQDDGGTCLLYVDRHLLHEVTSPQAFEGLTQAGRKLWRINANLAVVDHNVPTTDRSQGIADPTATILSVGLLLEHLGLVEEAARVEKAAVADIAGRRGQPRRSTSETGDAIAAAV